MPLKTKRLQPLLPRVTLHCDSTIALPLLVTAAARARSDLRLRPIRLRMKDLWASPPKKWRERTRLR